MNLATIAYVPILNRLHPKPFLINLNNFKTKHPLLLFSDYGGAGYEKFIQIDSPDPLKKSPNKVAVNNYLFLCALKIAAQMHIDRFIYLESDSRVGRDHWDQEMFSEAMQHNDAFAVGTPAIWYDRALPNDVKEEVLKSIDEYRAATGLSVANFKPKDHQKRIGPAWFLIGSACVYSTRAMVEIFNGFDKSPGKYACTMPAFDLYIGTRVMRLFGPKCVRKLRPITCSFSGFRDRVLTKDQRKEALISGRFCCVHQVKDNESVIP